MSDIREEVRRKYTDAIRRQSASCCCGKDCGSDPVTEGNYDRQELAERLDGLEIPSFGCGNPTALAAIEEGETVLDLGSGAGLDVFLASLQVGPSGHVYGLDMTEAMLEEAEKNRRRAGMENVSFIRGEMEAIPLPDGSVDRVLSNCVVNLSPDKDQVLREIFRVLRRGGRMALSDIVLLRPLPPSVQASVAAWTGCIAGALPVDVFRAKIDAVPFDDVTITLTKIYAFSDDEAAELFPDLSEEDRRLASGTVASAFISAVKGL
ncbi:arsenite methyltransferase [Aminithiophilus ramosus]|uniref:Arsenite methyltransferase n=2 Tax=Synergistales TaxID=649776 RepID=A0A9Q7ADQ3_9BACT|nr:arsenite methyltransferase [Aminithiophilus ramosus]QTX32474.1 arsenite methyltransferase [Aminithiophilus ramosus]QVL36351.1 arsenite methyltransferase [Synergistota bacterium]